MAFDTVALIWLMAGLGLGLFIAMAGFTVMGALERLRLSRRLKVARHKKLLTGPAPGGSSNLSSLPVPVSVAVNSAASVAVAVEMEQATAEERASLPQSIAEGQPHLVANEPAEPALEASDAQSDAVPATDAREAATAPEPEASATETAALVSAHPTAAVPAHSDDGLETTLTAGPVPPHDDIPIGPPRAVRPQRPQTEQEKAIAAAAARRRAALREREEAARIASQRAAELAEAQRLAEEAAAQERAEQERRAAEQAAQKMEQRRSELEREQEALARRRAAAERLAQKEAAKKAAAEQRLEELAAALQAQAELEAGGESEDLATAPEPAEAARNIAVPVDEEEQRRRIARRAAELRAEGARREGLRGAVQNITDGSSFADSSQPDEVTGPSVDVEDLFAQAFSESISSLRRQD